MKKFFFGILCTLLFIYLAGCQSVSKKIEDTTAKEEKELSKWLNKPEENLKSFYGQPDKIEFLKTIEQIIRMYDKNHYHFIELSIP